MLPKGAPPKPSGPLSSLSLMLMESLPRRRLEASRAPHEQLADRPNASSLVSAATCCSTAIRTSGSAKRTRHDAIRRTATKVTPTLVGARDLLGAASGI